MDVIDSERAATSNSSFGRQELPSKVALKKPQVDKKFKEDEDDFFEN